MTGDKRYREFASKQIDWLLGRNPWGTSMFTGIPDDGVYPKDVHLFPNALLKQMVRGGLVDGPVYRKVFQSLRGVSIRQPDPFAVFQDERAVYHDDPPFLFEPRMNADKRRAASIRGNLRLK